ncbi:MAG TPA: hypothetical protein VGM27_14270 [Acidobacteriaceae bacterium]
MLGQHTFTIHAGDFREGEAHFSALTDIFTLGVKGKTFAAKRVPASSLSAVEIATEENVKKLGGTVGWGLVGGALLGPAGMLAGLLLGGRGKNVVFVAKFDDGLKMLASAESKTFTAIQAAAFSVTAR